MVDTETTGLAVERHQIIELCVAIVLVNDAGHIIAVEVVRSGLVDPGHPLPVEIVELTGLTDTDLAGRSIDNDQVAEMLASCDGAMVFNTGFDRPHLEKLIGRHVPVAWGCAMADVPWRKLGFEPGPQGYVLMQAGYYMPRAHRAKDDVLALVELLDHVCADGETVMAKALAAMDAPTWRFEAQGAPYGYKDDHLPDEGRCADHAGRAVPDEPQQADYAGHDRSTPGLPARQTVPAAIVRRAIACEGRARRRTRMAGHPRCDEHGRGRS
ncbi:exonuclease domain-containing protein [Alteriqipengyuania flavescens]|uniref:exonuclease domain-containing protein n=1 Tax=Alteriqipengyuania flavescens TaxID=3053610 RepID=UPI0025B5B70B|nr:exonuclease domain-containing protein [Alteriqipengyuania flavescens]WJY19498.1 exonuclease domain-containing protein [Alteriqipengyuania flavescens]WJY25440.1 exonuclease domain-containing protein [Alteriqipengyuania flavescens]